ncbi:polyprenyl synthetase family protein [Clostridium folliculivorans]|uniref:Geranylgeranyl pyrophosphate synthase n=1 Tax=Clostridium folliculivorans TaxID=2886038 RepID=A0A9W5Y5K8_9CLOT|nr:polyprenyl synthetase family protein [Clostridium folliculivorans]GKU26995.1 geranylgeranyl pyrophosphate synthase [Clostridium folliculivorans]GKU29163.1 geranylgeranyl pyrophosphate synthase [Clostridium folliculivorans]
MDKFWSEYPVVNNDLEEVIKIIKKNIKCKEKLVENAILELVNSGGKLLRPAFLIIAARFGEFKEEDIYPLAAVLEMLHMATLVHDDIVDDSKLRRGTETVQSKYGKDYAVYIGDFLFCRCFKILSEHSTLKNINADSNVMSRICMGEIEQFSSKYNKQVSVKRYLKRISSKTAELFSLSFYSGATASRCDERLSRKLSNIGHNIGMAFQIIDDILDYTGSEEVVGKSIGTDIKQGLYTLPLIYVLEKKNPNLASILDKESVDDKDIREIADIVKSCGGIEKSRALAERYTNKAFNLINTLPEGENKNILLKTTEKLLVRFY